MSARCDTQMSYFQRVSLQQLETWYMLTVLSELKLKPVPLKTKHPYKGALGCILIR